MVSSWFQLRFAHFVCGFGPIGCISCAELGIRGFRCLWVSASLLVWSSSFHRWFELNWELNWFLLFSPSNLVIIETAGYVHVHLISQKFNARACVVCGLVSRVSKIARTLNISNCVVRLCGDFWGEFRLTFTHFVCGFERIWCLNGGVWGLFAISASHWSVGSTHQNSVASGWLKLS